MLVPCGKCVECLKSRQNAWVYRLQRETSYNRHSFFVTLTYDAEHVPLRLKDGQEYENIQDMYKYQFMRYSDYIKNKSILDCSMSLFPLDLTNYLKRLRSKLPEEYRIKYFACGEYGDQFNRPHYHLLIFSNDDVGLYIECAISEAWPFGMVDIQPVADGCIYYVTKYMLKGSNEKEPDDFCLRNFNRSSQGLGITGFVKDYKYYNSNTKSDEFMKTVSLNNGEQIVVPRYYRKTLLFDEQPVYDYDREQEIIDERITNDKQKFKDYAQKIKFKYRNDDIEKIIGNYNFNSDFERKARVKDTERRRRKGL